MYCYAQLNQDNICISLVETSEISENPELILVNSRDVLGKKYIDSEWVENDSESEIAEPTQLDKIEANLDYLVLLNS